LYIVKGFIDFAVAVNLKMIIDHQSSSGSSSKKDAVKNLVKAVKFWSKAVKFLPT
jgi:hypothetical protein